MQFQVQSHCRHPASFNVSPPCAPSFCACTILRVSIAVHCDRATQQRGWQQLRAFDNDGTVGIQELRFPPLLGLVDWALGRLSSKLLRPLSDGLHTSYIPPISSDIFGFYTWYRYWMAREMLFICLLSIYGRVTFINYRVRFFVAFLCRFRPCYIQWICFANQAVSWYGNLLRSHEGNSGARPPELLTV